MKPVMIIAIAGIIVAIGILAFIVTIQQSEISDIRRQEYLESSVTQCSSLIINVNYFSNEAVNRASQEWQRCMDQAMSLYGNSFQKENWEENKQQLLQNWINIPNYYEETSDFDLDEYWALRYQKITDPIEKKQAERQKELMLERIGSCPEEMTLIDCMNIDESKTKFGSNTGMENTIIKNQDSGNSEFFNNNCPSEYNIIKYDFKKYGEFHEADRNQNEIYCQKHNFDTGKTSYADD